MTMLSAHTYGPTRDPSFFKTLEKKGSTMRLQTPNYIEYKLPRSYRNRVKMPLAPGQFSEIHRDVPDMWYTRHHARVYDQDKYIGQAYIWVIWRPKRTTAGGVHRWIQYARLFTFDTSPENKHLPIARVADIHTSDHTCIYGRAQT